MRNAGMLTTTRVSDGIAFGPFSISTVLPVSLEAVEVSPLDQYSFASVVNCLALSSPRIERSCSAARARGLSPFASASSALLSRSLAISEPDARFSESICSSDSFTFCFNWPTNFSSVSNASSSGSVTCTEAVSDVAAGEGDADGVGEGVVCTTVVFELLAGAVQLVSRHTMKARIKSCRITIILGSSYWCVTGNEQRAFQRGVTL